MSYNLSSSIALLLIRLGFGGAMLYGHGWGKMMKLLEGGEIQFADPIGLGPTVSLALAVLAEAVCSALIILGLFTRFAAVPLIITMVVAIFFVHLDDPFSKMEKAILYLVPFVSLYIAGPGKFSLDRLLKRA